MDLTETDIRESMVLYNAFKKVTETRKHGLYGCFCNMHQGKVSEFLSWDQSKLSRVLHGVSKGSKQDNHSLQDIGVKLLQAALMVETEKLKEFQQEGGINNGR